MPLVRGTRRYPVLAGAEAAVVAYLLRATFNAADQGYADAQVLDTLAEGVQDGQLTVVEVDGTLAISGNKCAFTAQSTPANVDLAFGSQAITRALGVALILALDDSSTANEMTIGWEDSSTPGIYWASQQNAIWFENPTTYQFRSNDGGANQQFTNRSAGESEICIVLGGCSDSDGSLPYYSGQIKANYKRGAWFLGKGAAFGGATTWTLLWIDNLTTAATVYAQFSNYNSAGTIDDFKVPDKDLSAIQAAIVCFDSFADTNGTSLDAHTMDHGGLTWTEQSGNWDIQSNRANPDGAAIATVDPSVADALVDCIVNGGTADQPAIVLRLSDTSNYWYLQADRANNQLELHEYNATVDTVRASAAVTINNSTDYDLRAIADGATIDGFLDAGNKISYGSATLNQTATVHGIRAENTAGQFDNFATFPRTSSTYDSVLNGV